MIIMSVALSEQCNLNCTYCNVDKLSTKKINPALFLNELQKKRAELPGEIIQIDFYGGEPLLQWPLIKEIIEATKNFENIRYFMPTNGLLLNEEKIRYLNDHQVKVSLSFDGLWQKSNRPQHDGKDSLSLYLAKKELFKKINNLECHCMVYNHNFNLLENHLYIMEVLGINPNMTLIRDVGVWESGDSEKFNLGFSELLNWYTENVQYVEMPNLIREYLRHILLYTSKKLVVDNCGASETHFSFTENRLIPCNRFVDTDMILKIDEFKKMSACETCSVKNYCKKGCLFENIKNEGPIVEICEMYRHIYKELLTMVKDLNGNHSFRNVVMETLNEC